jgi:hypothetical protein
MLPIALPPAIPESRPSATVTRVARVEPSRAVEDASRPRARAIVIATEPVEPPPTVRFGLGLIVDTFA